MIAYNSSWMKWKRRPCEMRSKLRSWPFVCFTPKNINSIVYNKTAWLRQFLFLKKIHAIVMHFDSYWYWEFPYTPTQFSCVLLLVKMPNKMKKKKLLLEQSVGWRVTTNCTSHRDAIHLYYDVGPIRLLMHLYNSFFLHRAITATPAPTTTIAIKQPCQINFLAAVE